jgi:hypothetical protein
MSYQNRYGTNRSFKAPDVEHIVVPGDEAGESSFETGELTTYGPSVHHIIKDRKTGAILEEWDECSVDVVQVTPEARKREARIMEDIYPGAGDYLAKRYRKFDGEG